MKLKSLILGSVAAAGLSTAGYAADLGVLTSLDVCDSLGISGLTLSSTDHCLAITGNVSYEFTWGDYASDDFVIGTRGDGGLGLVDGGDGSNDWGSDVDAWIQFVGSSSSDFGRAAAVLKLEAENERDFSEGGADAGDQGDSTVYIDEAYVQVGDTTTILAGKKGSIANFGDDEPLNFLGLFNSEDVDKGVMFAADHPVEGGHVIQIVSAVADGFTVKAGLENLDSNDGDDEDAFPGAGSVSSGYYDGVTATESAGTLVGVVEYAGSGFKAHVTGLAGGVLDGYVDNWATHAGVTGNLDIFSFALAGAFSGNDEDDTYWNVLASAKATLDIFEVALSGEANGGYDGLTDDDIPTQTGFGGSVGASVIEGVKINLGARWFDENTDADDTETYQVAAQIVAAVSETITLTGEVGVYGTNLPAADEETDFYGSAQLEWKPGGGFTSSLKGEAHQTGAYKVTFKAAKEFK